MGLAWVLPFLSPNFHEPISSFYGEAAAAALCLLALTCLLFPSVGSGIELPRSAFVFPGFCVLILLHLLLGRNVYPQLNLLAVLYLLWGLALAGLAARLRVLFGQETVVTMLAWCLVAGALVSAIVGLCQFWGIGTPLSFLMLPQVGPRVEANTGQANHLANYLAMGLASLGYLYATRRTRLLAAGTAALPMLVVMGLSGSRSILLYLFALLVLAGVWRLLRPSQAASRLLGFSAAAAAAMLLVWWVVLPLLLPSAAGPTVETLQTRLAGEGMVSSIRLRQWHEAWLMFLDAPMMGIGYRQYAWQHFLLNAQLPLPRMFEAINDHAHNLLLHTMAEFGVAGLVVLLGGFAAWILGVRRNGLSAQMWWILALVGILGIHSMLEYPLWYAYFLGIAAVLIGLSDSVTVRLGNSTGGRPILVATLLLGWVAAAGIYQDYRTLQSLHGAEDQEARTGAGRNTAAVLLDLQQHSLFSPFVELALSRLMALDREQIGSKVEFNGMVMHFAPSLDVVYRQAILLALDGKIAEAKVQWDLARKNFPSGSAGVISLMQVLPAHDEPGVQELIRYAEQGGDKER